MIHVRYIRDAGVYYDPYILWVSMVMPLNGLDTVLKGDSLVAMILMVAEGRSLDCGM